MEKIIPVTVREVAFKLMGYTRSLELCARMNYETENLDFIDDIKAGNVFYDLGACEGRFSIYAALKGLKVFAFEPEAKNFKVLTENIELNELKNKITLFNVAVGDAVKQGIIKIGQPWEGGHQKVVDHRSIRQDLNFNFVAEQSIDIVDLDSFIKNNQLLFPDYLKIDIDGSEIPFLNGAVDTLSNTGLKGIVFELDKDDNYYTHIVKKLNDFGFTPIREYNVPNEKSLYNIVFKRI